MAFRTTSDSAITRSDNNRKPLDEQNGQARAVVSLLSLARASLFDLYLFNDAH